MPRRRYRTTSQWMMLLAFTVYFVLWLHDPPYELHAVNRDRVFSVRVCLTGYDSLFSH